MAKLSTTPGTRAEGFYRRGGWVEFSVDEVGDLLLRKALGGGGALSAHNRRKLRRRESACAAVLGRDEP